MLVFPQLGTGGYAQYPFKRKRTRRTVRNVMADGSMVGYGDGDGGQVRWSLPMNALSTAEAGAIEQLFQATEGRLRTFTFLDPAANLLAWSEDVTKAAWVADPLMQSTNAIPDPLGTERGIRLVSAGQAVQRIRQTLAVPASFLYCFSVWARSGGSAAVTLVRSAGGQSQRTTEVLSAKWKRVASAGVLGGDAAAVEFAVELTPGAMVDLFGLQVEAQIAPSEYMATRAVSGVYPAARFETDEWTVTAQSVESSDAMLRIVSPDR